MAFENRLGGSFFGLGSSEAGVCFRKLAVEFVDPRRAVLAGSNLPVANLSLQRRDSDRNAASNLSVPILSPASGIVWSVTNSGQYVRAGDEIARVIDCSQLSANATVSAREYAAVRDGDRAVFRQQDQEQPWKGTVAWAGVPESSESAIAAAVAPGSNNSQYRIIVALDDVSNATNCPAGKFGRVSFESTRAISGWRIPALDRLTAMIATLHSH